MDKKYYFLYKTSVTDEQAVGQLCYRLDTVIRDGHWNFDLRDADRILRIKSSDDIHEAVENLLREAGYTCVELHYSAEELNQMAISTA